MKIPLNFLSIFLILLVACQKKSSVPEPILIKSTDFEKGEKFLSYRNDSAFFYFNKSTNTSKDSTLIARAFTNMSIIQTDGGDFYGAQESALRALTFLNRNLANHHTGIASAYNELAATSIRLQNYETANTYYEKALQFVKEKRSKLILLNNKANALEKQKKYQEAIGIFKSAIKQVEKGSLEYARILSNMAKTEWLMDPTRNVLPNMLRALKIRIQKNDKWGQNASYAHLTEFYVKKNPDYAIHYAQKRLEISKELSSPDDEMSALKALIKLAPSSIGKHAQRYIYINDSLQSARNNAKNQFALIRYDAEKNKLENLQLQKENIKKNAEILRQQIILIAVLIIITIGGFSIRYWYIKRKQILMLNAERKIHANKLKTSQKVHDVVANGLYRIMAETEQQKGIDKEKLLDSIETLYEKSRDISYDEIKEIQKPSNERISTLISSFSSEKTKVLIVGNSPNIWQGIQPERIVHIEHILQELMVNQSKHSNADSVAIRFSRTGPTIEIHYTDNGVGMPAEIKYGNGLTNTVNRINQINGFLSFDRNTKNGVKILISFTLEQD